MVPGDKWELYIPSELAYGSVDKVLSLLLLLLLIPSELMYSPSSSSSSLFGSCSSPHF
jgi:hypothetical protein